MERVRGAHIYGASAWHDEADAAVGCSHEDRLVEWNPAAGKHQVNALAQREARGGLRVFEPANVVDPRPRRVDHRRCGDPSLLIRIG